MIRAIILLRIGNTLSNEIAAGLGKVMKDRRETGRASLRRIVSLYRVLLRVSHQLQARFVTRHKGQHVTVNVSAQAAHMRDQFCQDENSRIPIKAHPTFPLQRKKRNHFLYVLHNRASDSFYNKEERTRLVVTMPTWRTKAEKRDCEI